MRIMLIAVVVLLTFGVARADSGSVTYSSHDYNYSLTLPGGQVSDAASDPDWREDETTSFIWSSLQAKSPIAYITVNVFDVGRSATSADVTGYMADLNDPQVLADSQARLLSGAAPFNSANHEWQSALFQYTTADDPSQFEVFSTAQGQYVYLIYFDYRTGTTGGSLQAHDIVAQFRAPAG